MYKFIHFKQNLFLLHFLPFRNVFRRLQWIWTARGSEGGSSCNGRLAWIGREIRGRRGAPYRRRRWWQRTLGRRGRSGDRDRPRSRRHGIFTGVPPAPATSQLLKPHDCVVEVPVSRVLLQAAHGVHDVVGWHGPADGAPALGVGVPQVVVHLNHHRTSKIFFFIDCIFRRVQFM